MAVEERLAAEDGGHEPAPAARAAGGFRRSLRRPLDTLQTPYYKAFWGGNLLQFFCFNMNLIANQWLVTS